MSEQTAHGVTGAAQPDGENSGAESRGRAARVAAALRVPGVGLLLLVVGLAILFGFYDSHRMQSQTMEPSMSVNDRGFYADLEGEDVELGDIVRITPEWGDGQVLVFRVIGLPGDTMSRAAGGELSRNGSPLEEPYLADEATLPADPFEVSVPPGRVFVAGDSRAISNDSTVHVDEQSGSVAVDQISGRLVGVAWPVWHWSVPDTERSLPLLFVIGSGIAALGALILLFYLGRLVLSSAEALRASKARR